MYENAGQRILLFVGNHEEAERWLDSNRGSDFSFDKNNQTVAFTKVGIDRINSTPEPSGLPLNLVAEGPVWTRVPEEIVGRLGLSDPTKQVLRNLITFENCFEPFTLQILSALAYPSVEIETAILQSIAYIAAGRTPDAIARLKLAIGEAFTASAEPVGFAGAVRSGASGDSLVPLRDLSSTEIEQLMSEGFSDWMLFLHPDQREFVGREFNGAARVLGVSGSGKTCVLVHRARELVRRYPNQRILILTLGPSLVQLINHLLNRLCLPAERANIRAVNVRLLLSDGQNH